MVSSLSTSLLVVLFFQVSEADYSRATLPPLLEFINGTTVTSFSAWTERQTEIKTLLQEYFYGTFPTDSPPPIRTATVLNTTSTRGYTITWVNILYVTPINDTSIVIEIIFPAYCNSTNPCPVSMMSKEHRRWNHIAVLRGYVAINYPGGDNSCTDGSTCAYGDSTANFRYNYPNATFQLIARRAYLASRVVDYVITLPYVIPSQIGITGHSRNGKQSLIAGGYDERFTAIVDSSSGAAGLSPYRLSGGEGESERPASSWPGPWFLPYLRTFDGLEDQLPVDSHSITGLIAPRYLLLAHAQNDAVIPTRCVEAAYMEALSAYTFLNSSEAIRIDYRAGDHHGYEAPSRYIDWYDYVFNHTCPVTCGNECIDYRMHSVYETVETSSSRSLFSTVSPYGPNQWSQYGNLYHYFNWTNWSRYQSSPPPLVPVNNTPFGKIQWILGNSPASGPVPDPGGNYPPPSDLTYVDSLMNHDAQAGYTTNTVIRNNIAFGPNIISGQMYYRKDMKTDGSQLYPAVIWLHGADYNKGIQPSYPTDSIDMMHAIANETFVVISYDQLGFGMRLLEGTQFYNRWPTWSRFGAMVYDVMSAVDVLVANQTGFHPAGEPDALPPYPWIDINKIYVAGYSIGGAVGLYAAALDSRIAGVTTVSSWTPYRNDTDQARSGGNRRWYELHPVLPRLGYYRNNEENIPIEWDDILSVIQPRPVHAFVPLNDRFNDINGVQSMVQNLHDKGYTTLTLSSPPGVNSLNAQAREDTINWLVQIANG